MRLRTLVATTLLALISAAPARVHAQGKLIDATVDMLDRFFAARDKEKSESKGVESQVADLDSKISKFEQCKKDWEAAGAASGSRLGGFAARMAIRAKCGSSDSDGFRKDRQKLMDGPENAGAAAGKFKLDEYRNLKDKLLGYVNGDENWFTKPGLDVLKGYRSRLATDFGVTLASATQAGGMAGGRGAHGPSVWSQDYAWVWIAQMFTIQYLSGATMFESPYKPGEWTKWTISTDDNKEEVQQTERAFLGKTTEGAEWWRMKTITSYKDGDATKADTVTLEALFKPEQGNEQIQQLVRMRGKLPGSTEAQEMMVPQQWSMWNMNGSFQMKPTKESIEGATVGTETIKTPAGTFTAKHVRFGQGGGTIDWWLDEKTVGGWVKFAAIGDDKTERYRMELLGKGIGAKSELGVTIK
jgi:hypothetical protein